MNKSEARQVMDFEPVVQVSVNKKGDVLLYRKDRFPPSQLLINLTSVLANLPYEALEETERPEGDSWKMYTDDLTELDKGR